ncbi:hypothetical protein L209DRAFT_402864 [Thermothelomyces heterothallicus CBS 203.75]
MPEAIRGGSAPHRCRDTEALADNDSRKLHSSSNKQSDQIVDRGNIHCPIHGSIGATQTPRTVATILQI